MYYVLSRITVAFGLPAFRRLTYCARTRAHICTQEKPTPSRCDYDALSTSIHSTDFPGRTRRRLRRACAAIMRILVPGTADGGGRGRSSDPKNRSAATGDFFTRTKKTKTPQPTPSQTRNPIRQSRRVRLDGKTKSSVVRRDKSLCVCVVVISVGIVRMRRHFACGQHFMRKRRTSSIVTNDSKMYGRLGAISVS